VLAGCVLRSIPPCWFTVRPRASPALHLRTRRPYWNISKTAKDLRTARRSDIPTLLVSGTFDAVTPPSTGGAAAPTLTNSTVPAFPGVGHAVIQSSPCAQEVFASFRSDPAAPDTACVAEFTPPPFNTGE